MTNVVKEDESIDILSKNKREIDGIWTSDEEMVVDIIMPEIDNDLILNINVADIRPNVSGKVIINNLIEYNIDLTERGIKQFNLPNGLWDEGYLEISFVTEGADSPYNLGESDDIRMLGYKISELVIKSEQDS